jgi:hypothetical protein
MGENSFSGEVMKKIVGSSVFMVFIPVFLFVLTTTPRIGHRILTTEHSTHIQHGHYIPSGIHSWSQENSVRGSSYSDASITKDTLWMMSDTTVRCYDILQPVVDCSLKAGPTDNEGYAWTLPEYTESLGWGKALTEPIIGSWYLTPINYSGVHWIWPRNGNGLQCEHAFFRQTFELPESTIVHAAILEITVDNEYIVYLNGEEIGHDGDCRNPYEGEIWQTPETYHPDSSLFKSGLNVLAVHGFSNYYIAGARYRVSILVSYLHGRPVTPIWTSPQPYSGDVSIDTCIEVAFPTPVDTTTLNHMTFLVVSFKKGFMEGDINFDEDTKVLEFCPDDFFPPDDTIQVTLTEGIKDTAGNSLEDTTWWFVTGPGVYPGDTNNDGVVNEVDVLPLGIFWSWTDLARDSLGIDWTIKPVKQPWSDRAATYADANGDGVIDLKDLVAISANWGKTHAYAHPTLAPEALDSLAEQNPDAFKELYRGLKDEGSESGDKIRQILETVMNSDQTPDRFTLFQNHPNPFNPETEIGYFLPQASEVELTVYNVLGEKVKTLVDGFETAGLKRVQWDGTDDKGRAVASGIYFYRIKMGVFSQFKKMLLLR